MDPILKCLASGSESQEFPVSRKDGDMEACILQIDHDKPVLGLDLTHDKRDYQHFKFVSPQRSVQLPKISNGT